MKTFGSLTIIKEPTTVACGSPLSVDVEVKNISDTNKEFHLEMLFDDVLVLSTAEFSLASGAVKQQTLSQKAPLTGTSVQVKVNLYRSVAWEVLKPQLEDGTIGAEWWTYTEAARRVIAELAIKNTLFYQIRQGRSGDPDCAGGIGDLHGITCARNAMIRYLKFGSRTFDVSGCYYQNDENIEACYVPDAQYHLPCFMVDSASHPVWGHEMCAIQVNENIEDMNSWIFFQYSSFDIKPGDWQMPADRYAGNYYVEVRRVKSMLSCSSYTSSLIVRWDF